MPLATHIACRPLPRLRPLCFPPGVDIIEAGFPIASPDDFEAVRSIAMEVGNAVHDDGYVPVICGLSRTREKVRLFSHRSCVAVSGMAWYKGNVCRDQQALCVCLCAFVCL